MCIKYLRLHDIYPVSRCENETHEKIITVTIHVINHWRVKWHVECSSRKVLRVY